MFSIAMMRRVVGKRQAQRDVFFFFLVLFSPHSARSFFLDVRVLRSMLCCVNVIALGARARVVACLPTLWPVEAARDASVYGTNKKSFLFQREPA